MVSSASTTTAAAVLFTVERVPMPDRVARRAERVDLPTGSVEQDRHRSRRVGLTRRHERELVAEVHRVLDQPDNVAGHAVRDEGIADVHVEGRRGIAGHRDLAGAGRETPGDEAQRRMPVHAVRVLGAEIHRVARFPGPRCSGGRSPRPCGRHAAPPRHPRGLAPTNVIEPVAVPIAESRGSPALYARPTPTVVAATANTISATTSTCWRHSRRNSRHDQRKIARRAGPPPDADIQLPRSLLERQAHDFASGASSDSGPAGGIV